MTKQKIVVQDASEKPAVDILINGDHWATAVNPEAAWRMIANHLADVLSVQIADHTRPL